jgi:hypothetical protein
MTYRSTDWQEVPCATGLPLLPHAISDVGGNQTIQALPALVLTGNSTSTQQQVILATRSPLLKRASDGGKLLGIGNSWKYAEFNVFGLGNGSIAVFNFNSTIVVQIDATVAGDAAALPAVLWQPNKRSGHEAVHFGRKAPSVKA